MINKNVGDAPLPSSSLDSATDIRTSYDELRRLNRAEVEKKRLESLKRPTQPPPSESAMQPQEPPKPRKLHVTQLSLRLGLV